MNPEYLKSVGVVIMALAASIGAVDLRDISRAADTSAKNNALLVEILTEIRGKAGRGVEIATHNQEAIERLESTVSKKCK